jgi:hypothetical protein
MIIKQIIKTIFNFTLNLFKTILWFIQQIKYEDFHNYIIKSNQEKTLAIFATGPSLLDIVNSDKIDNICSNNDIIFVNDASISSYYEIIKPKYYIFADPGYWINQESTIKQREETFDAILVKTNWPIILFFPFRGLKIYPYKERFKKNANISILPYHTSIWTGYKYLTYCIYRKGLSMPRLQNVVSGAIFNGINLGYKIINLYGIDHSWTKYIDVNEKNQVYHIDNHFYDIQESPIKLWLKIDDQPYKMYEILRDISYMFESYHKLEAYACNEGVKIINHTKNSFVDAFKRSISE